MKTQSAPQEAGQPIGQLANIISLPKPPRATPTEIEPRFKIKSFKNGSGSLSWRVDGYKRDRTRVRENFADQIKAQARRDELQTEWLKGEARTEIRATKLTDDQIRLAEFAFIRLGPEKDQELPLAIEYWLEHGQQAAVIESPRLDDAFTQFSTWLNGTGCDLRELSKKNLRRRVNVFINSTPNLRVADVTPEVIDGFLSKRVVSAKSKGNDRRAVSRFFAWCIERPRKWCKINPARKETRDKRTDPAPSILTLDECERLLRAAETHDRGRLAPYIALCLFGGLRPYEAARLRSQAVNLSDNEIRLESHETKTGKSRVVTICPTLRAWLKAYKGKPFFPSNWRRDLDAIKVAAGVVKREAARSKDKKPKRKKGKVVKAYRYWRRLVPVNWAPDIMRHTAISHYFRKTGSYGRTAEQFGNSEAIIKEHYQSRVSSAETKRFYALRPRGGRK